MDSKAQQAGPLNLHQREKRHFWSGSGRKAGRKECQVLQRHCKLHQYLEVLQASLAPCSWDIRSILWEWEAHPGCGSRVRLCSSPLPSELSPDCQLETRHHKLLSLFAFINILIDIGFYCKRHHFLLIWVLEWHWQAEYLGSKQTPRGKGKYIPKNNNWKESNSIIDFVWYHSGTSSHLPVIFRFWWRQQVLFFSLWGFIVAVMQKNPKEKISIV